MTILTINTGTSANAGNGDSIRLAFHKVNQNFDFLNGVFLGTSSNFTESIQDVVKPMLVHPVHQGLVATYNSLDKRIVFTLQPSYVIEDLRVLNTTTMRNVVITGNMTIGSVQFNDDMNLTRNTVGALNFRIRNLAQTGTSEINLIDRGLGSFNIVHQNTGSNTGFFESGQNYIFDSNARAINIGRDSNINFYSRNNWSAYTNPELSITNTGTVNILSTLTIAKNFFKFNNKTVTVTGTTLLIDGIEISGVADKLESGIYTAALTTTGNLVLPGDTSLSYVPPKIGGSIIINSGTSFSSEAPFPGVGSIYFDGASCLEVTGGSHFDLNTGTFTLEWFQKPTWTPSYSVQTIFMLGNQFENKLFATNFKGGGFTATNIILENVREVAGLYQPGSFENTWSHIAIVKSLSELTIFINGVAAVSTSTASLPTATNTTSNLVIGASKNNFNYLSTYTGFISNMRWEARAIYTATFTPPTSMLTATSFTRLLLPAASSENFDQDLSKGYSEPVKLAITLNTSSLILTAEGKMTLNQSASYDANDPAGTLFRINTTQSRYTQMSVQNYSSGTAATSDLIFVRNDGSLVDQTGMIDIGINSSNYSESKFSIHSTGSAYVFSNDADLIIGTQSVGKRLKFHTDGTTTTNVAADVDANTWTFSRNLIPSLGNTYDLGSLDKQWKNLYIGGALHTARGTHNVFTTATAATSTTQYDCSTTQLFYHSTTGTVSNWTANLTNLNLVSGRATSVSIIIRQGTTGYYPSAVQIGGVAQTLNWQGNITPSPNVNRNDVVTFNILNNGGSYLVLGQLTGF